MGLKTLYNDIKDCLSQITDDKDEILFNYVGIWNNQIQDIKGENNWISIRYPAVFVEIVVKDIEQQALRHQLWNCDVFFHVVDDFYNGDNMEENTRIFEINDLLWKTMQCRKFPMSGIFIGTSQTQEFDHNNVYHYIQGFGCNYEYVYPDDKIFKNGLTLNVNFTGVTHT